MKNRVNQHKCETTGCNIARCEVPGCVTCNNPVVRKSEDKRFVSDIQLEMMKQAKLEGEVIGEACGWRDAIKFVTSSGRAGLAAWMEAEAERRGIKL